MSVDSVHFLGETMVWNSVSEFFSMGGYGLYVWGSVVVTFFFMISEVILLKIRTAAAWKQQRLARDLGDDEENNGVSSENETGGNVA